MAWSPQRGQRSTSQPEASQINEKPSKGVGAGELFLACLLKLAVRK